MRAIVGTGGRGGSVGDLNSIGVSGKISWDVPNVWRGGCAAYPMLAKAIIFRDKWLTSDNADSLELESGTVLQGQSDWAGSIAPADGVRLSSGNVVVDGVCELDGSNNAVKSRSGEQS